MLVVISLNILRSNILSTGLVHQKFVLYGSAATTVCSTAALTLMPLTEYNNITNHLLINVGVLAQLYFGPDLDQSSPNQQCILLAQTLTLPFRLVGKKVNYYAMNVTIHLINIFWAMYAVTLKHRGVLSHLPILSTLIRIVYVYAIYHLIRYYNISNVYSDFMMIVNQYPIECIALFIGLTIGDTIHWILDGCPVNSWGF